MKKLLVVLLLVVSVISVASAKTPEPDTSKDLVVLLTTGEKDVITKMVSVYLGFKRDSWGDITVLIWGPSGKLIANDKEVQEGIVKLQEKGIKIQVCKWCAEQYLVDAKLAELGFEVDYMGTPLTEYLQSDKRVIVF